MSEIPQSITTLTNTAKSIYAWSRDNNLVFHPKKTKFMLFSTKQMSTKHKLNEMSNKVMINENSSLDRVTNSRILGVNFDENLNWENHVTKVIKTCYSTLASLRKMKRLTDFKLRKQHSEQLVLSKFLYCDTDTYSHMEDQQYLMCYLKISKNLNLKKSLFLQLNTISSIKLMLMRYTLLLDLTFISLFYF